MGVWIETEVLDEVETEEEVTPCVGVWIETFEWTYVASESLGHTLRGCVDWNHIQACIAICKFVTSCVGVWIETLSNEHLLQSKFVTPCVGVWIETFNGTECFFNLCHTLRGCVDWNDVHWT